MCIHSFKERLVVKKIARQLRDEANKETIRVKRAAYRAAHRTELSQKYATYAAKNRDLINRVAARYRAAHRVEIREKRAVYVAENHPHVLALGRAWYTTNREMLNANRRKKPSQSRAALWPLTKQRIPRSIRQLTPEQAEKEREERNAKARICDRQRRLLNPEKSRMQSRLKRVRNLEVYRERDRRFKRAMDPRKRTEDYRAWRLANPEKARANVQRRRARKAGAPINDLSVPQWKEVLAAFQYKCAYCGEKPTGKGQMTQDHISPLVKQGSHTLHNVVPCCRECNEKKHTGPPLSPVQPLLLTIASARITK